MKKKGIQLQEAFTAVLTLVLIAILVIISLVLFQSVGTNTLAVGTAETAVNESISTPVTDGINLSASLRTAGACGAVTTLYNGTSGVNRAVNITQTGCTLTNKTDFVAEGLTSLKAGYPYTYNANTAATNASNSMITQFTAYPALVGLVGTVIFLGIIIGVLVASFAFGKPTAV